MDKFATTAKIIADTYGQSATRDELALFFAAGDEDALYTATPDELAHEYAEYCGWLN